MKIAVTIWEDRISPVFDSARQFLLAAVEDGRVCREMRCLIESSPYTVLEKLRAAGEVEILLCGAICEEGMQRIQADGIELIPFLSGDAEEIIQRFAAGKPLKKFAMPGCRRQCCRRRRAESICPMKTKENEGRNGRGRHGHIQTMPFK